MEENLRLNYSPDSVMFQYGKRHFTCDFKIPNHPTVNSVFVKLSTKEIKKHPNKRSDWEIRLAMRIWLNDGRFADAKCPVMTVEKTSKRLIKSLVNHIGDDFKNNAGNITLPNKNVPCHLLSDILTAFVEFAKESTNSGTKYTGDFLFLRASKPDENNQWVTGNVTPNELNPIHPIEKGNQSCRQL